MTTNEKMAKARAAKAIHAERRKRDEQRELYRQLALANRTANSCMTQYLALEDHSTEQALTLQRRILGASRMVTYYNERLDA